MYQGRIYRLYSNFLHKNYCPTEEEGTSGAPSPPPLIEYVLRYVIIDPKLKLYVLFYVPKNLFKGETPLWK